MACTGQLEGSALQIPKIFDLEQHIQHEYHDRHFTDSTAGLLVNGVFVFFVSGFEKLANIFFRFAGIRCVKLIKTIQPRLVCIKIYLNLRRTPNRFEICTWDFVLI